MTRRPLMLAAVLSGFATLAAAAAPTTPSSAGSRVYRIELAAGGVIWSDDAPMQSGEQILFHGHPTGALQSLRRTDIKRIVATSVAVVPTSSVKPGEAMDIGVTGASGRGRSAAPARPSASANALRPGEGRGGTALFNPDRTYRPDWDSKLVPGATMGLPNSPNDYREGATLAHPAAGASQSAPGEPPMMKPSSGEPPKSPNQ